MTTLYHYTSPDAARNILRNGLEARDPDFLNQPTGAYLTVDDRWGWFGDVVLTVQVDERRVQPDPYYEDRTSIPNTSYVLPGRHREVVVPPERINVFRDKNLTPR